MTDAKLPKLADGSRWDGDILIDRDGDEVSIGDGMLNIDNSCGRGERHPADALAVIRRAGLDPLAIAAKELIRYRETSCEPFPGVELDFIELAKALL